MNLPLALPQTVSVPTLNESVESVERVGLANTLVLILVLFLLAGLAIIGWNAILIMRSIARDNTESAKAAAVALNGQQHMEGKLDRMLDTVTKIEGKLDRVLDRRN